MYTSRYAIGVEKACKKYPIKDKKAIVKTLEKLMENLDPMELLN